MWPTTMKPKRTRPTDQRPCRLAHSQITGTNHHGARPVSTDLRSAGSVAASRIHETSCGRSAEPRNTPTRARKPIPTEIPGDDTFLIERRRITASASMAMECRTISP